MGGMLALGVGKVVGSVVEKISQAEDNNVALDRLKRSLGDVNVSFNALKSVVHDGADSLRITYTEAGQLAQQFTKLGNVSGDSTKDLAGELGVGVGMSRAFGLDPSQGVGVLGQMRGIGVTRNTQESRRFALLIGETIGKSGAFAKADEVMDAIAGYAAMQTRAGVGGANVGGYAGMFSSLVGSGLAGLDPAGSGALISRVNASLAAGGAKGEASQFLTAIVGQRMGLDSLQTQVLREGGMFSTMSSSFGAGSSYARYMGGSGPSGDKTFFEGTMAAINSMPQYANNPLLKAQAVANHTGVNMRQAMALMSVKPGQMGGMMDVLQASGIDMNNMRADGIAGVSKALYGSGDDRRALANSLAAGKGDRAMSAGDLEALDKTMASGSEDEQKRLLASLAAKYGQEQTQGQDIRDSKNSLDNIKTNLADKLVPYVNEMRHGIMFMAGDRGKMSSSEIMSRMINADADARIGQIEAEYKGKIDAKEDEWRTARSEGMRTNDPALMARADEIEKELEALKKEQSDKIKKENVARDASIAGIEESTKARLELAVQEREEAERRKELLGAGDAGPRHGATPVKGGRGNINPPLVGAAPVGLSGDLEAKLSAAESSNGLPAGTLRAVIAQETGGRTAEFLNDPEKYHYGLNAQGRRIAGHTGKVSTAFGPFGILESTGAKPGYGVSPLKDKSMDEQIRFAAEYLAARSRSAGSLSAGLAGYGEGAGYSRSVMGRIGNTPLPPQAASSPGNAAQGVRISADDITVRVVDQNGMPTQANQSIQTRVTAASPFGLRMN